MSEGYTNIAGQRVDVPEPAVAFSGTTMGGATYKVVGSILQAVLLRLRAGQEIYTESGSLSWMQDGITMNTNLQGGLGDVFKRVVAGESLFIVSYQAQHDGAEIAFASDFPGKILALNLGEGQSIIAQRGAFLVGERSVSIEIFFNRRLGAGFFGGEGLILQRLTGPGTIFVTIDGEIVEYTLQPGERLKVDTGHVAMFEPTVQFDIEWVKGFKNILFGGEGLFFATLTGPGRVWLQTMPMSKLAGAIASFLPRSEGKSQSFGVNLGDLLGGR